MSHLNIDSSIVWEEKYNNKIYFYIINLKGYEVVLDTIDVQKGDY